MREKNSTKEKNQLKSILLIFILVTSSILVIFPLTTPEVKAQVIHLNCASAEDLAGLPYDIGPVGDGEVIWDPNEDHIINDPMGYAVDPGFTLNIPALDYFWGEPDRHEITFQGSATGSKIDVFGKLITNSDNDPNTLTAFLGEDNGSWDGIYFHPGSEGRIIDSLIRGASSGIIFEPGSKCTGVGQMMGNTYFEDIGAYGIRMDGVLGHTTIGHVQFLDYPDPTATCLYVANSSLSLYQTFFYSHGPGLPCLHISNASVNVVDCQFNGKNHLGNTVLIEEGSNGTKFNKCLFFHGGVEDHFVRVDGSSCFFYDCSFKTLEGERSLLANEDDQGVPSHLTVRQPTADGSAGMWDDTFDNSTMNVTGDSSITLQWYMDVYLEDPDGSPIENGIVQVNDTLGNPAEPPFKLTDDRGWAEWFIVTELIQYNDSKTYFSPFNVTADAFSMRAYADPEPVMNMSKEINITVPFNPSNVPPIIYWVTTPIGVQTGDITIQYRLEDPNPDDNGSLSVEVYYSIDNLNWDPATQGGGDPTTGLDNDTVYTFIWDSASSDLNDRYYTTVYLKIIPYDREGNGTPIQTGNFTVDNKPPELFLPPMVSGITDTTATITWSVDEKCNATVSYGLYGDGTTDDLTFGETGSVLTTDQSVTLTGLQPGRKYTFAVSSTNIFGFTTSSEGELPDDDNYTFETEVYIQLYKGWNMFSIPPDIASYDILDVLATIIGDFDTVWCYFGGDPSGDYWKVYDVNKPFGNDLTQIIPGAGVWIHMLNDAVLKLDHTPDMEPPWKEMGLFYGWNFIGYNSAQTRTIQKALDYYGVNYEVIRTYDAATEQWLFNDGPDGAADTLTHMKIGKGYWIYVTQFHIWSLPYAE